MGQGMSCKCLKEDENPTLAKNRKSNQQTGQIVNKKDVDSLVSSYAETSPTAKRKAYVEPKMSIIQERLSENRADSKYRSGKIESSEVPTTDLNTDTSLNANNPLNQSKQTFEQQSTLKTLMTNTSDMDKDFSETNGATAIKETPHASNDTSLMDTVEIKEATNFDSQKTMGQQSEESKKQVQISVQNEDNEDDKEEDDNVEPLQNMQQLQQRGRMQTVQLNKNQGQLANLKSQSHVSVASTQMDRISASDDATSDGATTFMKRIDEQSNSQVSGMKSIRSEDQESDTDMIRLSGVEGKSNMDSESDTDMMRMDEESDNDDDN